MREDWHKWCRACGTHYSVCNCTKPLKKFICTSCGFLTESKPDDEGEATCTACVFGMTRDEYVLFKSKLPSPDHQ